MGSYENLKPFKKGHKKLGGRKKGVPNKSSLGLQKPILAALDRIGSDGKGTGGYVGFVASLSRKEIVKLVARMLAIEEKATPKRVIREAPPSRAMQDFLSTFSSDKLTEKEKKTYF